MWHDRIVFSYAGDLWTVGTQGGTAVRLTSNPGLELFGKFSPDGRQIAFTGQYGGDEQVYVMPVGRRRAEAAHLLSGARVRSPTAGVTTIRSMAGRRTARPCCSDRRATATC